MLRMKSAVLRPPWYGWPSRKMVGEPFAFISIARANDAAASAWPSGPSAQASTAATSIPVDVAQSFQLVSTFFQSLFWQAIMSNAFSGATLSAQSWTMSPRTSVSPCMDLSAPASPWPM